MTQYINPFTARSGVDPRFVVGRDAEISFFNDRLSRAFRGQCEHYVITGSWGVGKTVLLRPEIRSPAEVLRRLTEKGLVNRKTRGQYTIDDELFGEYLRQMRDD